MSGRSPPRIAAVASVALLASFALAHGAEPVGPDPETGSVLKQRLELLEDSTDLADRFLAIRAVGYVDGIADAAAGLGYACFPTGVARAEIREAVMSYLRNNPGRLGDPASLLVLNGLFEAYPCKRQE
jgi:hypothetical protein